jgi:hypothetical protein
VWVGLSFDDYWPFLTSMFLHGGWLHLIARVLDQAGSVEVVRQANRVRMLEAAEGPGALLRYPTSVPRAIAPPAEARR